MSRAISLSLSLFLFQSHTQRPNVAHAPTRIKFERGRGWAGAIATRRQASGLMPLYKQGRTLAQRQLYRQTRGKATRQVRILTRYAAPDLRTSVSRILHRGPQRNVHIRGPEPYPSVSIFLATYRGDIDGVETASAATSSRLLGRIFRAASPSDRERRGAQSPRRSR